jgi:hypothetical protein
MMVAVLAREVLLLEDNNAEFKGLKNTSSTIIGAKVIGIT